MLKYLLGLLLFVQLAHAQSPVRQSGTVTQGHAVRWVTDGVIADAGTAASGSLTSLGVTNNGGPGICVNSGPITGAYNSICLSAGTTSGGSIAVTNFNGATGGLILPTIQTPPNTLTMGLNIVQSGPTSGTTAGPWSFNLISVTDSGNALSTGAPPNRDAFDLFNGVSSAFRVNATHGGAQPPIRIAGTFASNFVGVFPNAETVGLIGSAYSNEGPGALWGTIGYSSIGPAGTVSALIPVAAEVSAATGSTVLRRMGFLAISEAPVQGSVDDAVLIVAAQNVGAGTPGGFKNVIKISNNWFGSTAMDVGANFFSADSATAITNFAQMPNVSVVGNIFLFQNLFVPGAAPGFTLPTHVTGAFQYGGTSVDGIAMNVNAFTGPALFGGTRANTSSTAPSAVQADETIVSFVGFPYDGAAYAQTGGMGVRAGQNQAIGAHGTYLSFFTTPSSSTTVTEQLRLNMNGVLGLGTTTGLTSVNTLYANLMIGANNNIQGEKAGGTGTSIFINQNTFWDGSTWRYISTYNASNYFQFEGTHNFRVAASGTAGAAITWIDALAISTTGQPKVFPSTATPAGGTTGAGLTFGTTSNLGIFFGSGAPTLAAAKGSLYLRSDGSTTNDRMYINTDSSTTWTAVTTAL